MDLPAQPQHRGDADDAPHQNVACGIDHAQNLVIAVQGLQFSTMSQTKYELLRDASDEKRKYEPERMHYEKEIRPLMR